MCMNSVHELLYKTFRHSCKRAKGPVTERRVHLEMVQIKLTVWYTRCTKTKLCHFTIWQYLDNYCLLISFKLERNRLLIEDIFHKLQKLSPWNKMIFYSKYDVLICQSCYLKQMCLFDIETHLVLYLWIPAWRVVICNHATKK